MLYWLRLILLDMKPEDVFAKLKEKKPRAIVLFGSAARGELHEDSDLDILIVQDTDLAFSDRIRRLRSEIRTRIPLDIIVLTPQEAEDLPKRSSFFAQIINEGKIIYGGI